MNASADLPDVSANGRYVVFETTATNLGGPRQPIPEPTSTSTCTPSPQGEAQCWSRANQRGLGGEGRERFGHASLPVELGRFVAFQTSATNLGGPIASSLNSYVYDRKRQRVTLVSRASGGGPGANDYAGEPSIAGGGRFVAFYTPADNIDPPGEPAYHGNLPANTNLYRFQFAP